MRETTGGHRPVVLTIAGSDSGGGAGIQADIKTFQAHGVFGASAITAVTAQNTLGVHAAQPVDARLVEKQILAVATDLRPAACKLGMLATAEVAEAVADALGQTELPNQVLDPVMVATSGDRLLTEEAVRVLKRRLLPLAVIVTPNLDEAEVLCGSPVRDQKGMHRAAQELLKLGCRSVLIKGGHLEGPEILDLYSDAAGAREWILPRLPTGDAHGTGCTLSAAIAARLALGDPLIEAVQAGLVYTRRALEGAMNPGAGAAVLDHWAGSEITEG
ncbi:MAG: bifunctional hydroxymethylpyrimidine kinase/phosphomethylpyrimidine kinase [Gemmatimonadota bacterium]